MKAWIKWIGTAVACLALFYFGLRFSDQVGEALPLIVESGKVYWLLLGALLVAPQMAFAALAWRSILQLLGSDVSKRSSVRIVFLSQFARYIPGNVGHHLGKLALAKKVGIGLKVGTASIVVESICVLLLGLVISAYYLPQQLFDVLPQRDWLWLFCIGLIGVFLLAVCLYWQRQRCCEFLQKLRELVCDWRRTSGRLLQVFVYYWINFLFIGGLAWLIATQVFGAYELSIWQLTSLMAFAWTIGFLAPGAPAGLGVREVIALVLLRDVYTPEVAMGLLVLHRLVLTFGDLLTFCIGLIMAWASSDELTEELNEG